MTEDTNPSIAVICCSVLRHEVMALMKDNWPGPAIRFLSSMLHMKPDKLANRLDVLIEEARRNGHRVLLVYGDCCMQMEALTEKSGVVRIRGNNCFELILGTAEYRRLSHEGAFFLLPEWTRLWKHIFSVELGLNQVNAAGLMGDLHKKLVYLDTGIVPVPVDELQNFSKHCGLPWEAMRVFPDQLRAVLNDAIYKLKAMKNLV